ncbi:PREDICTED: uncharacterized protein LOC109330862 [Lupinus angustifolius]|uniref:uncharacterized protein LOC109330862 n=1 Tax=Lupinus angustifolius TaxID=3871 RepID=UPI00092F16FD|nr:PREDICTED: uncharacterized protein LOC109330862 [Lupinus angustifolius]
MTNPMRHDGMRIQESILSNTTLLGKLVWNLMYNGDKLWVKVLHQKYLQDAFVMDATTSTHCSYTWKGIVKAKNELKRGFLWRLGSRTISLWSDHWMEEGNLCSLVDYVHIIDTQLRVKDVWSNGIWDLSIYYTPMLEALRQLICAQLNWGVYCFFGLPMLRALYGLTQSPACGRCLAICEDILHYIRDYPHSLKVCYRLGFRHKYLFNVEDHMVWLKTFTWGHDAYLFLAGLWWIWQWRHSMVLGDDVWNIDIITHKIRVETIPSSLDSANVDEATTTKSIHYVSWAPPPSGFIKLNVDGSCMGEGHLISFKGVLRDTTGVWLLGFSASYMLDHTFREANGVADFLAKKGANGFSESWTTPPAVCVPLVAADSSGCVHECK